MKKSALFLVAAVAITMVLISACGGNSAPEAKLGNDNDSLSYLYGYSEGRGFAAQQEQGGFDSKYYNDIVRGIADGATVYADSAKLAYVIGLQIGVGLSQTAKSINQYVAESDSVEYITANNILAGFIGGMKNDTAVYNMDPYQASMKARNDITNLREEIIAEKNAQLYTANKEAGEAFMAEIAQKEGIQALENGVYYEVITEGEGEKATEESVVNVKYVGSLIDGTVFDQSGDEPVKFHVQQVIPGFSQALLNMPAGSKWKVYIPQDQAYGNRQTGGSIMPFSALVFEIELVSIEQQ